MLVEGRVVLMYKVCLPRVEIYRVAILSIQYKVCQGFWL